MAREGLRASHEIPNQIIVDAKEVGNLMRFTAHMPYEPITYKGHQLTANLGLVCAPSLQGRAKCFLLTIKSINAYEELGWNYGPRYFKNEGKLQGYTLLASLSEEYAKYAVSESTLHDHDYTFVENALMIGTTLLLNHAVQHYYGA